MQSRKGGVVTISSGRRKLHIPEVDTDEIREKKT